jgi:hypothetical protein
MDGCFALEESSPPFHGSEFLLSFHIRSYWKPQEDILRDIGSTFLLHTL